MRLSATLCLLRRTGVLALCLLIAPVPALQGCGGGGDGCCKVCSVGKACGDTCIAANQTCSATSGCACNN